MNQINKAIRVAVGIAVFFAGYWFLTRNQIVTEFMRPRVESGQVGVATANIVASVIEILAAIGGVVIALATKLLEYIANSIEPLVRHITGIQPDSSSIDPDDSDPRRLAEDLSRLLIQSVIEGNRPLTIQLAHRLAKKEFLDRSNGGSQ